MPLGCSINTYAPTCHEGWGLMGIEEEGGDAYLPTFKFQNPVLNMYVNNEPDV